MCIRDRLCIVLQGLSQLKAIYEKTWESIIGNCSIFTFLGTNDQDSREYVSKKLGTSRLSFADESYMEEYLDITPGSVSVLGLMNDTENHVQLVIDEDVLKGEYVGCHPCINTSSLRVRTADLMEKIIPAMHHEAKIIRI